MNVSAWLGSALWMAACIGFGFLASRRVWRQAECLEGFWRFFCELSDTVLPLSVPLPEACLHFARKGTDPACFFAGELARRLSCGEEGDAAWKAALDAMEKQAEFSPEEKYLVLIREAGSCLQARGDAELQRILRRACLDLEREKETAKSKAETLGRLYRTLGFIAAVMALLVVG